MLKLLTIGNSFSNNATRYLEEMFAAAGKDLLLGKTSLGGCSLAKHWNLVEQCELLPDVKPYDFYRTGRESVPASLQDGLTAEAWDYVTIQQVSHESWRPETYEPYAGNLYTLIRESAPQAEVLLHQTWAYRVDAPLLQEFGVDQQGMFERLTAAYGALAERFNCRILPSGDAIRRARAAFDFRVDPDYDFADPAPLDLPDQSRSLIVGHFWRTGNTASGKAELSLDERHLNAKGCFAANCVWFEMLTGLAAAENSFVPDGVSAAEADILRTAAHAAVAAYGGPLQPGMALN